MTDSMKFGPEWLRNLSGDNCNSGVGGGGTANLITPRYQLAEHRYGREEMLALFDRNCKPPEGLVNSATLYVEKTQLPLAFIPETEDETRARNSGVSNTGGRGRGGSVDRGRIRSGRGGMYSSHYSRVIGFDDSGDGSRLDSQPYSSRNRVFDRSQSERGWTERNGLSDSSDWNGSTSPRKELGRGTSGSALMEGNWRRPRGTADEDEGWRSNPSSRAEKWGRGSWREGADRDRTEGDADDGRVAGRWETRNMHRSSHDSAHHHHHPPRTARTWDSNHHDNHDLPEWATENPSESGGSFDASGAFHGGMFSDEDEEGVGHGGTQEHRTRRVSEGTNSANLRPGGSKPIAYNNNSVNTNVSRQSSAPSTSAPRERPKSLHPFEDKEATSVVEQGRSISPTKQVTSASSNSLVKSANNSATKKIASVSASKPVVVESTTKMQAPQRSKSFVELPSKSNTNILRETQAPQSPASLAATSNPQKLHSNTHESVPDNSKLTRKPDDALDRMNVEALVAKLMDEEGHRDESVAPGLPAVGSHAPPMAPSTPEEKWFYRDPQGEVQGPFAASEMAEWCKAGYFTPGLLVRRNCDERYTTLGDLMKLCGRSPFIPGPPIPPIKLTEPVMSTIPTAVPTGLPGSALPKPGIKDPILLLQYQQLRMMHNQQNFRNLLLSQMKNSAVAKLSQSEHWNTLTAIEQNQLVMQCVMQDCESRGDIPMATNPFLPPTMTPPSTNSVMQLFSQIQAKNQSETTLPPNHAPPPVHPGGSLDHIQQLIQQMGGMPNIPTPAQPNLNAQPAEDDPIKSFLHQLHVNANGHPPLHQIDSIWPQPPTPQMNPQFNAQNWLAQVGPLPPMPPGQTPNSLWDLHTKEMKTEQQILEEQNNRIQERRKKEELRQQEELKRQAEDENAKRKLEEDQRQLEEARRKEEERKLKEKEKKQKEDERRKQEEDLKKKEEKKRKEEERKREEKRKLDEENNKKKQEEEKKKREEAKKQEEKLKKEEEKRKKLEEELKRAEDERIKREEEARKRAEADEQARRAEQRRREAEALKKLQERSKAPWAQAPHAPTPTPHASLAEIQRLEREKKAEEQRCQQMLQQQLAQQKAVEAAKEASAMDSSKRLQFKWAERVAPTNKQPQVKSLAQIQQEEQERVAKVKQQEKERLEKNNAKEIVAALQNAGIWGTASQSLSWATTANSINDSSKSASAAWTAGGFWDEPVPTKTVAKAPVKIAAAATSVKSSAAPPAQLQPQNNLKAPKAKLKKEEEFAKKMFDNSTKPDDFTQWCNRTLNGLQVTVDIPTFVGFLRDIESAYEVKEYVRMYLGDSKQSADFAKQFLEKRSKWRSAQRPQAEADDLCKPAPAVNPNAPAEFQEVKGKTKKPKKGKMFKVDNRILGFSVTAATDRINVGDRDYGEGV